MITVIVIIIITDGTIVIVWIINTTINRQRNKSTLKTSAMKASTRRKILRWAHILLSIPIVGYVYGPVSKIPQAVFVVRWILFPVVVLTGLWMWLGQRVAKSLRRKTVLE